MGLIAFMFIVSVITVLIRVLYLIYRIVGLECSFNTENVSLKTIYCIGSGGHTSELLRIMSHLDTQKFSPRLYIMAKNDTSSEVKIINAEQKETSYTIYKIPRSRNVKQSYLSSIFTTLYATLCTVPIIYKFKPDIIFCNGPGTCIPVCLVAFFLRCVYLLDCRIIFIESLCRVRTLSLSGKIMQFFADIFVIQWPQLRPACFRAKYFGRLT